MSYEAAISALTTSGIPVGCSPSGTIPSGPSPLSDVIFPENGPLYMTEDPRCSVSGMMLDRLTWTHIGLPVIWSVSCSSNHHLLCFSFRCVVGSRVYWRRLNWSLASVYCLSKRGWTDYDVMISASQPLELLILFCWVSLSHRRVAMDQLHLDKHIFLSSLMEIICFFLTA